MEYTNTNNTGTSINTKSRTQVQEQVENLFASIKSLEESFNGLEEKLSSVIWNSEENGTLGTDVPAPTLVSHAMTLRDMTWKLEALGRKMESVRRNIQL